MTPAMIEPAAALGATAAHSLLTANPMATAASRPASALNSAPATNFQTQLASLQTQGIHGLIGMKSGDLQQVLHALNPQQRLSVAQQLMGSSVTVQNGAGQMVHGVAGKLQVQNGEPVFNVAGKNYSLASLAGVSQTPYA